MVWYGVAWHGMAWYSMLWYVMVLHGMVRCGIADGVSVLPSKVGDVKVYFKNPENPRIVQS